MQAQWYKNNLYCSNEIKNFLLKLAYGQIEAHEAQKIASEFFARSSDDTDPKQIKSKHRIKEYGEVYTNQREIDGVDVSGCEYLVDKEACRDMNSESVNCKRNNNCLFKQLSRKTQEYEELKEEYEAVKSESFTREELITLQEKDIDRYRKALEEIEEICINDIHEFADGTQVRYDSLDEILNIINKAKGRIDD